jgi:hypothetical protein
VVLQFRGFPYGIAQERVPAPNRFFGPQLGVAYRHADLMKRLRLEAEGIDCLLAALEEL